MGRGHARLTALRCLQPRFAPASRSPSVVERQQCARSTSLVRQTIAPTFLSRPLSSSRCLSPRPGADYTHRTGWPGPSAVFSLLNPSPLLSVGTLASLPPTLIQPTLASASCCGISALQFVCRSLILCWRLLSNSLQRSSRASRSLPRCGRKPHSDLELTLSPAHPLQINPHFQPSPLLDLRLLFAALLATGR